MQILERTSGTVTVNYDSVLQSIFLDNMCRWWRRFLLRLLLLLSISIRHNSDILFWSKKTTQILAILSVQLTLTKTKSDARCSDVGLQLVRKKEKNNNAKNNLVTKKR